MYFILSILICIKAYDWSPLEQVMKEGIGEHAFPGGVIIVGNATDTIFQQSYGHYTYQKDIHEVKVTTDTKYQIASLTKIMATTLALMNMVSSNSISIDDKVSKYVQNYDTNKKGNTTIKNLLLHNAGLPFDYPHPLPSTPDDVINYIRLMKPVYSVGSQFTYSDLGFLLLGKIVQNITKRNFNDYCQQNNIFAGLTDTCFNPSQDQFHRIPPTQFQSEVRKKIIRGQTHDRLSYFFGGVAGHSGLFSTTKDLLRYFRILLNSGKLPEDIRTLPSSIVELFLRRVEGLPYENTRALGFDTLCPSSKMSNCFGHGGFTGTMAWADRDKKIVFIVLTNRIHPDPNNMIFFNKYQEKISSAIFQILGY